MVWRVEVREKSGYYDALGASAKRDIEDLGCRNKVKDVKAIQVYLLDGDFNKDEMTRICEEILTDPITQYYRYDGTITDESGYRSVEIAYNPGVMDPVEESAKKAVLDMGIRRIRSVKTARKYLIKGSLTQDELRAISEKIFCNKVIQHAVKGRAAIHPEVPPYKFELKHVDMLKADDRRLVKISKEGQLFLNLEEMRAIKRYFTKLRRNPTDCELETLAQTWSEHCKHKTLKGTIEYREEIPTTKDQPPTTKIPAKHINNLLKSTVMRVTDELDKPWCVSVFKDNAGIIRFDKSNNICFKVETHNHPSALEPYGGAGTGIGGVIRDTLGTGLGAKPVLNTDIFCFGPTDYPYSKLPKGTLHPKRIMKGVVAGVRDYGNRMGIPTSNGAVLFDKDFLGNPLVFCGNVGIMPRKSSFKKVSKGDLIVVVGGHTGRDGIHGATFSSGELTHESEEISGSAVQIGNPIQEKKVADAMLKARNLGLYGAVTDCGAGGLSSAVGEMGEDTGAEVHLEKVPLKYKGLRYDEIWISEAQERMVLAVKPENIERLKDVFDGENVEATVIGRFTGDRRLRLFYGRNSVCDMDMGFIHDGVPNLRRSAVWKKPYFPEPRLRRTGNLTGDLLGLLSAPNIASKEWIIRQYDHEVQGGSILKPLQGRNFGPGDACVAMPVLGSKSGIAVSCGINIDYGKIDPYWMAASSIDEALRQIISVGGDLERTAILDNFCWGNTNKPDRLGGLVRAAQACYDIAKAYEVPFISGKDSLNNEYSTGGKTISIPPTLLISCVSIIDDVSRIVSMDAKASGNSIYIIGITYNELGGSQYYKLEGFTGNGVPRVDAKYGRALMLALGAAIKSGNIRSCHDCSDGGLGVALAEMAFAGSLGMDIDLGPKHRPIRQPALPDHVMLFSESNTRFVAEVDDEKGFEKAMRGLPLWKIGAISHGGSFRIRGSENRIIVNTNIERLKEAWQAPFKNL